MDSNDQQSLPSIKSVEDFIAREYDYVIVGGGTAGLVLAARLTEHPNTTVGVIEAGIPRFGDPLVDTPALFSQMFGRSDYDWNFKSVPQSANKNKIHHMPRGKMLGGSSGINFMVYNRGTDADYDDWSTLVNDPTWSAKEMKAYMRKGQTLEPYDDTLTDRKNIPVVTANHGTNGYIRTGFNHTLLPIEEDIMEAAKEACGLPTALLDPCNGDRPGFFRSLGLVARTGPNKGMRSYAARTYFLQYAERPNLNVICSALASKVVLEGKTARAVEFEHVGNKYTIKARQEVIICCGAIQTPQLLELSGIGDPQVLRKAGVECKIELPSVGRNYQDHICSGMSYELKAGNLSLDAIWSPDVMADAQCLYQEQQRGPLSSQLPGTGFFPHRTFATDAELDETIASIRATQREPRTSELYKTQLENVVSRLEDRCGGDLQLLILPATLHWKDATEDQSRLHTPMDPAEPHGFSLMVGLQYPVSRGSIHITSADPKVQPAIDPAYLSHPADVAVLSAGIKFLDKLVNIQNMSSKIAKRTLPEPDVDLTNTEVASAHVRDFCTQEYHSCGTCAMGEVLDSRLRVKGVEGLRICDASAFPAFVSGNIISTVYAMAEKAADMIKEDCRAT